MFNYNRRLLELAANRLSGFKKIFWVIGGACSGKSTVCQSISARRNLPVYDMDAHVYGAYIESYTWERHPASKTWFSASDPLQWVLSLSWQKFNSLNRAANVEYLDLFAEDLKRNPVEGPLLVDGGITHPSILSQVLPSERIVCLETDVEANATAWNDDPGRASMKSAVLSLAYPKGAWQKFLKWDRLISETILTESRQLGIMVHRRNKTTSVDDSTKLVLGHFGI